MDAPFDCVILLQIPDLKQSHVHIKNVENVTHKIQSLIKGTQEKLQVLKWTIYYGVLRNIFNLCC
jgi:hypothetical protein